MYCKNCGNELTENGVVCLKCGVEVGKGNKYCANCGAQPDPLASICVSCGCRLNMPTHKKQYEAAVDSFGSAIKSCFDKYAVFTGRSNRSEYWYFYLFTCLISFVPFVGFIGALALIVPSLAVGVRRFHDIGKSGWNLLFSLIPIVGTVLCIVWLCQPSQEGDNEYGPNPNM